MSIQNTLKYSCISICLLLCSLYTWAQPAGDSTAPVKPKEHYGHQLCFGVDIFSPIMTASIGNRHGYEFSLDYYLKNELYIVAEGGWGNATINYPDLAYTSTNTFFRFGINKSIVGRLNSKDWDIAFIGLRYGVAPIQRSEATYVVIDSFFGNSSGTIPAANLTNHWLEVTGGMRVELFAGISAGYTIRGKFRLNDKAFKELAPAYIAGYGQGDKNSIFDFNLYITYAIRWKKSDLAK